jgi:hypothetical protein
MHHRHRPGPQRRNRPSQRREEGNPVKVKIARHVCDIWPGDDLPLDLKALMKEVVTFIRMANGPSERLPVQPIPDWRPMA